MPDASGIAEGFDRYRAALADLGAVDFDEQIYRAIEILLTDPDARAAAQARCRRLLVDEFQDLTPAHLLMIRLLAAPGYDCFGVGDDDQVIYGYSGATPEFLIGFPRYFPGAAHHPLEVNYRCPPCGRRRGAPPPLLQPPPAGQDHPLAGGSPRRPAGHRRPAGRSGPGGRARRGRRRPGRAGGGDHLRVARRRGRPRGHRRAGPGQLGPAARPGGLRRSRHSEQHAARGEGPGPHRHPHRLRLPADRGRSGPHPPGGHPGHHPPPVAGHRPDGGGHGDQVGRPPPPRTSAGWPAG